MRQAVIVLDEESVIIVLDYAVAFMAFMAVHAINNLFWNNGRMNEY